MGTRAEHSVKRHALEVFGALALGGLLLFGAVGFLGHALTSGLDGGLTHAQRTEIKVADCKQLIELEYRYIPNGDSVEPDMTALRLTRDRVAQLHCSLPPDLRPLAPEAN